ncbi:MAG: hypothetical protein FWD44_00305 [Oscillospiraceae bacterium]|nr:hypothetical protein [Oscillospiraceae bacterium]
MTKTNMENVKINAFCAIVIVLSLIVIGYLGITGNIEMQMSERIQDAAVLAGS